MNDIRSFFSSAIGGIATCTAAVYGVTYLGRVYLQINPLHAALLSLGTYIAADLASTVARKIINNGEVSANGEISKRTLCVGKLVHYVIPQIPMALALASGAYSLLQIITTYGLAHLCAFHYVTLTGLLSSDKIVAEVDEVVEGDADRMQTEIDNDEVDVSRMNAREISIVSIDNRTIDARGIDGNRMDASVTSTGGINIGRIDNRGIGINRMNTSVTSTGGISIGRISS